MAQQLLFQQGSTEIKSVFYSNYAKFLFSTTKNVNVNLKYSLLKSQVLSLLLLHLQEFI